MGGAEDPGRMKQGPGKLYNSQRRSGCYREIISGKCRDQVISLQRLSTQVRVDHSDSWLQG